METNLKTMRARLKKTPEVRVDLIANFETDWLAASSLIETEKRNLLRQLKTDLHCLVASLDIDDLEFKVMPHVVVSDDGLGNYQTKLKEE